MQSKYFFLIVFIATLLIACNDDNVNLGYEPGIYRPYKQTVSKIYAFADNEEVDGIDIKVPESHFSQNGDPTLKPLLHSTFILGKNNLASIYSPTNTINMQMVINPSDGKISLTTVNLSNVVKFDPYTQLGVSIAKGEEALRYGTLQGEITENGFKVFTYNIYLRSGIIRRSTPDAYYMDLDYLKSVLNKNDTLIYVEKETFFRK